MIMGENSVEKFKVGDAVVYPSHGVGEIVQIEAQTIANITIELLVIFFSKEKMTLRIPKNKAQKAGLRQLSNVEQFKKALDILKEPPYINKMIWSKKSQELETKINSGSIILLAEVLRDLYRNEESSKERPYSERVLYQLALERFINEYSAAFSTPKDDAIVKITEIIEFSRERMIGEENVA